MGTVFRAVDEHLNRAVALKVLSLLTIDAEIEARARSRFRREARAAAQLQHPNVVTLFDSGTDPDLDVDYLVMELLSGEDLSARLRREARIDWREATAIAVQAAHGIGAGHKAGIVHRDIKPANLFLSTRSQASVPLVRVLDFGIAQVSVDDATGTQLTQLGHNPLSPAYASPEQLAGSSDLPPTTDVYSLGATLYHMVSGTRLPGKSGATNDLQDPQQLSDSSRDESLVGIPDALIRVLNRALSPLPSNRFRDANEFAGALEEVLAGSHRGHTEPAVFSPPSQDTAPATPGRSRIAIFLVCVGVGVAAIAGVALWSGGSSPERFLPGQQGSKSAWAECEDLSHYSSEQTVKSQEQHLGACLRAAQTDSLEEPKRAQASVIASDHLLWLDRPSEAATAARNAIALAPDSAFGYQRLGIALDSLGRLEEALSSFKAAQERKPDLHWAYISTGSVLERMGRYGDALQEYRQGLSVYEQESTSPDPFTRRIAEIGYPIAQYHERIGAALLAIDSTEEALAAYRRNADLLPNDADAWAAVGWVAADQGRLAEANAAYRRVISIDPTYLERAPGHLERWKRSQRRQQ